MIDPATTRTVLVLGRRKVVIDDVRRQLDIPGVQMIGGSGVDDVRSAFATANIDHVIIGGGIDLETRLQSIREVLQTSDTTTVHMNSVTGPDGFLPFVRSVLRGLDDYEL